MSLVVVFGLGNLNMIDGTSGEDANLSTLKSKLAQAEESVKYWHHIAVTDDLTGLHNRRMLHEIPSEIRNRRDGAIRGQVTLLFIDLDDFGQINKKYGDDVGDEALRLIGTTIQKNIREEDIAIRKGGDEFVLFLMGTTPELAAEAVVKRLELLLDGGVTLNVRGELIPLKGSMGVFGYDHGLTPSENLRHADYLMRQKKSARKKCRIAGSK